MGRTGDALLTTPLSRLQGALRTVSQRIETRTQMLESSERVYNAHSAPRLMKLGGMMVTSVACALIARSEANTGAGGLFAPLLIGCSSVLAFASCAITARTCAAVAKTGCMPIEEHDLEAQREALQQDQESAASLTRTIFLCEALRTNEQGPVSIIQDYLDDPEEPARLEMPGIDGDQENEPDVEAGSGAGVRAGGVDELDRVR